ncbi:hypothetical protein EUA93_04875 [Nocardioides oleivorans]|uniref:Uncharacterized protein n=1 Tax=Nocardioides oleivorans TaxID=273676 RepID=A0A4Q2RXI6_9ACTN|nr:hypothetical protein [Nocardioides oleivorans]RYB93748.1 hypothetical protein EUA93_04875 [Nocardioides oleivorans]
MHEDRWHMHLDDEPHPSGGRLWGEPPLLAGGGRVSHLVFLDGRLVDAWTDDPSDTPYDALARQYDAERTPQVVRSPPPPPRHQQVLAWLDGIAGGREALLALAPDPAKPLLREVLDPVADEPWLVVDELVADVCEELLSPDLEAPLRRCLLLLHAKAPWLPERLAPDRVAAGIVWLVGKANAAIGPAGPVTQVSIASRLGVSSLGTHGGAVCGHVRRVGWPSSRPWPHAYPELYATGRAELLTASVVDDLVLMRDQALAERDRDVS